MTSRNPTQGGESVGASSASAEGLARFGVVIADDDENVRLALVGLFGEHTGFRLVGQASTGIEAAGLCASLRTDVALVDVMMPSGGCAAATAIRAVSPHTVIAAYTARTDRRTHTELTACGVARVFVKGGSDDLADALYVLVNQHRRRR